jgi:hypothetical protein
MASTGNPVAAILFSGGDAPAVSPPLRALVRLGHRREGTRFLKSRTAVCAGNLTGREVCSAAWTHDIVHSKPSHKWVPQIRRICPLQEGSIPKQVHRLDLRLASKKRLRVEKRTSPLVDP